jgi:hypothetical protein
MEDDAFQPDDLLLRSILAQALDSVLLVCSHDVFVCLLCRASAPRCAVSSQDLSDRHGEAFDAALATIYQLFKAVRRRVHVRMQLYACLRRLTSLDAGVASLCARGGVGCLPRRNCECFRSHSLTRCADAAL